MTKKLNVAELFAGVGGFRVGLERSSKTFFKTVYANQWEPQTTKQHAFEVYIENFGETNKNQFHDNTNIFIVNDILSENPSYIKDKIDLVVGGFPCQDYSVATSNAKGLEGKKGVLWWEIEKFIRHKNPSYLLLENVDRLLTSPKNQKGRDFLIMLAVFAKYNYNVEWRVINAAEYGFSQRRKRVFIFACKNDSNINKNIDFTEENNTILTKNLNKENIHFELRTKNVFDYKIDDISNEEMFNFFNYGYMLNGEITSIKIKEKYKGTYKTLNDILEKNVSKEFYLNKSQQERIFKLKDGGKKERITKEGFKYIYSEGKMSRWDNHDGKPGRTMLTSEGTINRSSHIIKEGNKYRYITPIEAERLNGFNDGWTSCIESINKRYFMMGNALVTDVIKKIGDNIMYFENKN